MGYVYEPNSWIEFIIVTPVTLPLEAQPNKYVGDMYRSDTVNSKSFVGKVFLRIKCKFELTVHFKHEMIGKHFIETSN